MEDHGHVARPRRQIGNDSFADYDVALGRIFYAGNHAHQGALAAAGGTEKNKKLALLGLEVDTVDCAHVAEQFRDRACLDSTHQRLVLTDAMYGTSAGVFCCSR